MNNHIVKADKGNLENIIKLHDIYMPDSFFSFLGIKFLKILYYHLIKSQYAETYVYTYNSAIIGYISFTTNKKLLFFDMLKKNLLNILFSLNIKNVYLITIYFLNSLLYLFKLNSCVAELLFIAVNEKYQNQKIASHLIDLSEQMLLCKAIHKVQVAVNADNLVCKNLVQHKNYIYKYSMKLYGKNIKIYFKKL